MKITAVTAAIIFTLTGCGTLPEISPQQPAQQHLPTQDSGLKPRLNSGLDSRLAAIRTRTIQQRLYSQHKKWKGTRYRLGGLSKRGIDCSGFVLTTFQEQFGITLPRTTAQQAKQGAEIPRSRLRAGDLVFFKTSRRVRHVGIYIEDEKFLHASTSKGVTISNLNTPYWRATYWKAIRI